MVIGGIGGSCGTLRVNVCKFIFEDYILIIENVSFFLFIFLLVGIVFYFNLNKNKIRDKNKKIKMKFKKKIFILGFISLFLFFTSFLYTFLDLIIPKDIFRECRGEMQTVCGGGGGIKKPIIYLYPEEKQEVKVELEVSGEIIADYPKYDEDIKGWEVTAYPDGKVIDDGKEYSYIFWEAEFENNDWDLSKGFIVEGKDSIKFLQEKLSYIGLTPKEYNEFIVYWYPKMMNNKYNLVYFAGENYTSRAPLKITPKPDSVLRVFTVIKPLEEKIEIEEQVLEKFERKGFSVVEWGGTILE